MRDTMEERGETLAAGISYFGPIMESHYQSESCPGRPNEAPHGEGWPLHDETREEKKEGLRGARWTDKERVLGRHQIYK